MKERPILFNALMVKAILEGRKIQTRRVLKVQPPVIKNKVIPLYQVEPAPKVTEVSFHEVLKNDIPHCQSFFKCKCPYGKIGDRLWVRETFMDLSGTGVEHRNSEGRLQKYAYAAECLPRSHSDELRKEFGLKWKPSIHMPRSASRILLEITNVRVERLNQISRADAVKEGLHQLPTTGRYVINKGDQYFGGASSNPCEVFQWLWEDINGAGSWNKNPWVWVTEFKVIQDGGES